MGELTGGAALLPRWLPRPPQVPAGVETMLEVFEGRHTFTVGPLQVYAPVTVNAGRLAANAAGDDGGDA